MGEELRVRDVLNDAWRLSRKASQTVLIVGSLLVLSYTATDLTPNETLLVTFQGVLGLVVLYLQLVVTGVALSKANLTGYDYNPRSPTRGRFPAVFGQSLIFVVALIAGLALLVVPGLILLVRWCVCIPALLAENLTITDSFRRSWELTRRNWISVGVIEGIVLLLWLIPIGILFLAYPDYGSPSVYVALPVNALACLGAIAGWLITTSLYVGLVNGDISWGRSEEVLSTAPA